MPTPTEEFPCRTKEIAAARFYVKIYDVDGSLCMSTSYETREQAEKWIMKMKTIRPVCYGEILEKRWVETVCIECGQEVDVW